MIVVNAHRINKGYFPYLNVKDKDFFFEQVLLPEDIHKTILDLVGIRLPQYQNFDPIDDIQVLTPMKKGLLGVYNLNESLQALLNPPSPDKKELHFRSHISRRGTKSCRLRTTMRKKYSTATNV